MRRPDQYRLYSMHISSCFFFVFLQSLPWPRHDFSDAPHAFIDSSDFCVFFFFSTLSASGATLLALLGDTRHGAAPTFFRSHLVQLWLVRTDRTGRGMALRKPAMLFVPARRPVPATRGHTTFHIPGPRATVTVATSLLQRVIILLHTHSSCRPTSPPTRWKAGIRLMFHVDPSGWEPSRSLPESDGRTPEMPWPIWQVGSPS
jgi:hypothetical protein